MVGRRQLTCCCVFVAALSSPSVIRAETFGPTGTVLPVEGEAFSARLVSVDGAGRVVFQPDAEVGASAAEAVRAFPIDELVQWGSPARVAAQPIVLLSDGSRLMAAADWSGGVAVRLDGDTAVVRSDEWGDVRLSRASIRGVVFAQRTRVAEREKLAELVRASEGTQDQVLLTNQDRQTGAIKELPGGSITVATAAGDAKLPLSRVEAVIFAKAEKTGDSADQSSASVAAHPQAPNCKMIVGMRDGSLLNSEGLVVDDKRVDVDLVGGLKLAGSSRDQIVLLQSLNGSFVYLSDLEPADYRHVPYLDVPWPYKRDRNVFEEPLDVDGVRYLKGIGMHSAARLTYKLERQYKRFDAEVALDDSAGKRGSVVFGVYVLRDAKWQPAFASNVVRGGEAPRPVSVDIAGADAMTLVVDFADRGDELDHADWLDARLTK
jgi:hypothetical protein